MIIPERKNSAQKRPEHKKKFKKRKDCCTITAVLFISIRQQCRSVSDAGPSAVQVRQRGRSVSGADPFPVHAPYAACGVGKRFLEVYRVYRIETGESRSNDE